MTAVPSKSLATLEAAALETPSPSAPAVETVELGEKGSERYRSDKRVRKYLLAKRPLPDRVEEIITYRSKATLGANMAIRDQADPEIIDFLIGERECAIERLEVLLPEIDWRKTLKRKGSASETSTTAEETGENA